MSGATFQTVEDLVQQMGAVPLHRIRMHPTPGQATEEDLLDLWERHDVLCELIDGVLVEKAMGTPEANVASVMLVRLYTYVRERKLGRALGADGMLRLMPKVVRVPDVSFISSARLPKGEAAKARVWQATPDLAVEVLSEGNTRGEIDRKLKDLFFTGCRLVWVINPRNQTAEEYTAPDAKRRIGKSGALEGGDVVPGFRIVLRDLFAEAAEELEE